ncbi:hypothetical protein GGI07_001522 [Coemansia sp. Benny D115]|nr:hypothetical protein GGI07_001522 [Coemansia sp. Benny D115]
MTRGLGRRWATELIVRMGSSGGANRATLRLANTTRAPCKLHSRHNDDASAGLRDKRMLHSSSTVSAVSTRNDYLQADEAKIQTRTGTANSVSNGNAQLPEPSSFVELSIDPKLAEAAARLYKIERPTAMQCAIIRSIMEPTNNVLLRHETGSGKTVAILLALLTLSLPHNQPPRRKNDPLDVGRRSLFLAPNRELALQLEAWALELLQHAYPGGTVSVYKCMQRFVGGAPYYNTQLKVLQRHGVPRLVLGTPKSLLEIAGEALDQQDSRHLLLQGFERIVIDEIDGMLRLPGRHATERQVELREKKPRPGQVLVEKILGIPSTHVSKGGTRKDKKEARRKAYLPPNGRESNAKGWNKLPSEMINAPLQTPPGWAMQGYRDMQGSPDGDSAAGAPAVPKIQLIMASATVNKDVRKFLRTRGWTTRPADILDSEKQISMPLFTRHYCLVIENEETIRNIESKQEQEQEQTEDGDEEGSISFKHQHGVKTKSKRKKITNPWEADVSLRSAEQKTSINQLMAEVASNVLREMHAKGTAILFTRSDANLREFAATLKTYGIEAKDIMTRYETKATEATEATEDGEPAKNVYLATEEAARGVDIPDTHLVILIDVPKSISSYIHLAGRAGRFGGEGDVVSVVPVGRIGFYESKMRGIFNTLKIKPTRIDFVE